MQKSIKEKVQNLESHLIMIKSLKESEKQDEFYVLLQKAKDQLGDVSPHMAKFYFEYGCLLLNKIENGMDILNANAVPEGQNQDDFPLIEQASDDEGDDQNKEIKNSQKKQIQQIPENPVSENLNVEILQNPEANQKEGQVPKIQDNPENNEQQQKDDDIDIAYQYLQASLKLYQDEKNRISNGQNILSSEQVDKYITLIHNRLGDLYMVDEHYQQAIQQYRTVVKIEVEKDNYKQNRRLSEAHYMIGNCLLYDNKPNCEKYAVEQYIKAITILVNHLEIVENCDTSKFQIPTEEKIRIDRFFYLPSPGDSQKILQIKDVISLLLDKIEDTFEQIGRKVTQENEKVKKSQLKDQNIFKQVSKDAKVINLDTFDNQKDGSFSVTNSQVQKNDQKLPLNSEENDKSTTISIIKPNEQAINQVIVI